jgi:hypothetical protein
VWPVPSWRPLCKLRNHTLLDLYRVWPERVEPSKAKWSKAKQRGSVRWCVCQWQRVLAAESSAEGRTSSWVSLAQKPEGCKVGVRVQTWRKHGCASPTLGPYSVSVAQLHVVCGISVRRTRAAPLLNYEYVRGPSVIGNVFCRKACCVLCCGYVQGRKW